VENQRTGSAPPLSVRAHHKFGKVRSVRDSA